MTNNFPIVEELEAMCETDDITFGRTIGHGIPARFTAHIRQDSRPELAEKIERLFCLLGTDD